MPLQQPAGTGVHVQDEVGLGRIATKGTDVGFEEGRTTSWETAAWPDSGPVRTFEILMTRLLIRCVVDRPPSVLAHWRWPLLSQASPETVLRAVTAMLASSAA